MVGAASVPIPKFASPLQHTLMRTSESDTNMDTAIHVMGRRSATVAGGFRGVSMRGGFVGSRSFALRPGFAPPSARFNRYGHRRFAFAEVPFAVGVGLYGGSCWTWQPPGAGCGFGPVTTTTGTTDTTKQA